MAKHQCPSCGHNFNTASKPKKSKSAAPYQYAEIIFADNISILSGTYSGSLDRATESAVYLRALSLSGGRWMDKANLAKVPSVDEARWLSAEEVETVRDFAFDQRENEKDGWGRNLTHPELWARP